MIAKVGKHRKARRRNAQNNQAQKLQQLQSPAVPEHPISRDQNKPEVKAQHAVLDPENRSGTQSDQECLPRCDLTVQADTAQSVIEREHDQRQRELLGAAAFEERRYRIDQRRREEQKDRIPLPGHKQVAFPGQAKKRPRRRHFQQPAAEECFV